MAVTGRKHVMLSYQWDNKALVSKVYKILIDDGIKVWMDVNGGMGDNVNISMAQGVENAEVFCCFMTPQYETSYNCQREYEYANDKRVRVIPCMIGDTNNRKWRPSGSLGLITAGLQFVNFRDASDSNVELKAKELIGRIKNKPSTSTIEPPSLNLLEPIREKYLQENQIKRLTNEAKSFPIEQSYINLAIVETKELQEKEKKLKQDKDILGTFEEIYGNKTTINIGNIFEKCKDQTKKVLVLGRAGIGKSTFCQYITYRWAKGEIWSQYELVILIRLRSLIDSRYPRGKNYAPIDLVKKEYFPFQNVSEKEQQTFEEQCNQGRVLWILDGYDEFAQNIPEQLQDAFDHVCKKQHHILTSRPYAIALPYDTKMEITGFSDENIAKYIEQFFDQFKTELVNPLSSSQKLLEFLKSNRSIWGIAHIPVNLELICSLWSDYDWSKTAILTMTQLYSKITEWLCRRYLSRQNINHENMTQQGLYRKCNTELRFLEHLAFNAMERKEIILPPELLEEAENEIECSLDDYPQLLNMGILKSYEDKSIGEHIVANRQHYFVHLSFQEYFAARHLLKILKDSNRQKAIDFININKYNQRFHFVFVFASGLLAQSDFKSSIEAFWNIIQGEPLDLVGLKHMTLMIECIDQLIGTTVSPSLAAYLKTISQWIQWIAMNVTELGRSVEETLLLSLERTNSLVNTSIIQNKLIELLTTPDEHTKSIIYPIIAASRTMNPVPKLLSMICADAELQDGDSYIRMFACYILGTMGESAATNEVIATLLTALSDENLDVKRSACYALGSIGKKAAKNEVIAALLNALRDKECDVRILASEALDNMGEKVAKYEVIAALLNPLGDEDLDVGKNACEAILNICGKTVTNEVIAALLNALRDENSSVRGYACKLLLQMGDEAGTNEVIDALLNALRNEDSGARRYACKLLLQMGEEAGTNEKIAARVHALLDEDKNVRRCVGEALGNMSEDAAMQEIITALLNAIRDENCDVRSNAYEAFGKIGEEEGANEVITVLLNTLRDKDADLRRYMCGALEKLDENAPTNQIIIALLKALGNENSFVRGYACKLLLKMSEVGATNEVIDALLNVLLDRDSDVRTYACYTLGKMGESAARDDVITALVNAVRDTDADVRKYACEALAKMGEKAATDEVIDTLLNELRGADVNYAGSLCRALGELGAKVVTNKVIIGLLHFQGIVLAEDMDAALMGAICSYHGVKELESEMVSKLFSYFDDTPRGWWSHIPSDHLLKVFLDSENVTWVPNVVRVALYQGVAVTATGNDLRIYDNHGLSELRASDSKLKVLIEAFRCQKGELEGGPIAVKETESKAAQTLGDD